MCDWPGRKKFLAGPYPVRDALKPFAQAAAGQLTARLEREAIAVLEAREQDYSLEDVFLAIVEKSRRAEDRTAA